jgi:hypothetical protein
MVVLLPAQPSSWLWPHHSLRTITAGELQPVITTGAEIMDQLFARA